MKTVEALKNFFGTEEKPVATEELKAMNENERWELAKMVADYSGIAVEHPKFGTYPTPR